jgi:sugar phosphate permease
MPSLSPPLARPRYHYGWLTLFMATLVVFASLGLARFGYTLLLPSMQAGLGMDNTQAGALVSANLVGYLTLSLLGGALAARFGARRVVAAGLAVTAVGMVLTGLSGSFAEAALWRAITGIGSGASNVPAMGLLVAWFAARRRGVATGVAVAGSSVALILIGPIVPRLLLAYEPDGWRVSWFVFGAATLAIAAACWFLLRNRPGDLGLEAVGDRAVAEPGNAGSGKLEWGRVYRSGPVWRLGFVYLAFGFAYIIYLTFFTKRLLAEGGYTVQEAGTLFMTLGWFSLLCGLLWGWVSDAIGRKQAMIIVYLIQALSFGTFALWPTPLGFTLSAILFGLTAWSIPAIMAAACGDLLGPRMAPAALGFVTLFFGAGQAIGPSVAGLMADASGSFVSAYLLAGAVSLVGAVGASLLRSTPGTNEHRFSDL